MMAAKRSPKPAAKAARKPARASKRKPARKPARKPVRKKTADTSRAKRIIKQRRDATAIDRLPEALRATVRAMYDDPSVDYQTIADTVLIQTCPPSVRRTVRSWLARLRANARRDARDGVTWQSVYERSRRDYRDQLASSREVRASGVEPVAISDSQLSRDYRAASLLAKELSDLVAMHGEAFERLGAKSLLGIGQTTANLLQLKAQRALMACEDDPSLLAKCAPIIRAAASYYNAQVKHERERSRRERVVREVQDRMLVRLRDELRKRPKLMREIEETLASVAEELS